MSKLVLSLLLIGAAAEAQAPSAGVVGRIVDPTGAVIPGVEVAVINLDTNQSFKGVSNEVEP